ncbi:FAD dependent oxidoreductase [Penicillium brevicompactum]|uniref:FAD dependent oxidoreductase n=1 Tax=Penicillium brevicompactum TaxID=5074 RepID=A0A9W9RV68_PENBR|nr:FAD dependent oxidoreductase [Penicillium brevicompactum]
MAQSLPSLPKGIPSALVMWKDMSPYDARLRAVSPSSPRILVIGGGVTGLITSWALLDKGYHVTILSKEWASYGREQRLTSQIAGALWEFPPAVCGQHTDAISLAHSNRWCMVAYHNWDQMAACPSISSASGVSMKPADFFFFNSIQENPGQLAKMEKIMASGVRGFVHSSHLIKKYHINPQYVVDAYEHLAPVIDTDQCMDWLMKLVQAKGAILVKETLQGDLLECEEQLRRRFQVDVILNAIGLAGELAGDTSCYPIRGGLIRVINDGLDFPKVEAALSISSDAALSSDAVFSADAAPSADAAQSEHGFVFLLPRNDNILLIGGIAEPHEWNLNLTLDSQIIKRMRERCEIFLPSLKSARLDPDYPLAQGLRPFRAKNVRVERELRRLGRKPSRIVHSYGQGGAGWSLCFGCASDALALIEEALLDLEPMPMASLDSSCPMLSQTMQAHL